MTKTNHKKLLRYISSDLGLISLLYDLNMLPEQLKEGSQDWIRMLVITLHWRASMAEHDKNKAVSIKSTI